ncbi:hypothetical protein FH972_017579 [Carpinus fangiana]|uniref:Glycine-rich protein n=1 Tax=Carpinus fangiana TaxID=176857 RepID=A0A5N6RN97_9ROSI|nr:hypothetical protein FH972_017579 [Carpinus fangiana]
MKLLAVLFFVLVVTSSCLAVPMRGLSGGTFRQEQGFHVGKGKGEAVVAVESKAEYSDSNIENHHNIPRQYYNDHGGDSQGGNGNG